MNDGPSDLKTRSARGGALTVLSQGLRLVVAFGSTAVLARILEPADFGLVAMVTAITGLVLRFKDLGLAASTVQQKEISHAQVSFLFWVNLAAGIAAAAVVAVGSPLVGWFYGEPRLVTITLALSLAVALASLGVQHTALLRRRMQFGRLVVVQIGSALIGAAAGIVASVQGAGYWALVFMQVATGAAEGLLPIALSGWLPGAPRRAPGAKRLVLFGGNVTLSTALSYVVRNLDNVLIGYRWGSDVLGYYSRAYRLLLLPIQQLSAPLGSVIIAALARLQDEPVRYRRYYVSGIRLLTAVGMPGVVFTFVAVESVVMLVLGPGWEPANDMFRALAPAAFLGTFNSAGGWVYLSFGHVHRQLRWSVVSSVVTTAAFFVGLPYGALGVALAFSVTQLLLRGPGLAYAYRDTPIRLHDLGEAIWRPTTASLTAGLLVHLVPLPELGAALTVLATFALMTISYIGVWLVLPGGRRAARELIDLLLLVRRKT